MNIDSWEDVEDILFDGSPEEISQVYCPDCKGPIIYNYFPKTHSMDVRCKECGILIRSNCYKNEYPNCFIYKNN